MQEKRTFLNFHLRYVLVRGNFDAPEGGGRGEREKKHFLGCFIIFYFPPKIVDTAAFYFAVSAISRRFHRPRMIDRNNYTRGTIHVPNNGIAVVCHREKQKNNKKNTYLLQTNARARTRSFCLSTSRSTRDWRRIFEQCITKWTQWTLVSFDGYPVSPSLKSRFAWL